MWESIGQIELLQELLGVPPTNTDELLQRSLEELLELSESFHLQLPLRG